MWGVQFEKSGQGKPLQRSDLWAEPEGASREELKYTGKETTCVQRPWGWNELLFRELEQADVAGA